MTARSGIVQERAAELVGRDRARNLPGYGGCGVCGTADIDAVLRTPPRIASETRVAETAHGPGVYEAVMTELAERRGG